MTPAPTAPAAPTVPPPPQRVAAPADIELWCFGLAGTPSADEWACLDANERQRAHRFVFDRDRHRHVRAHAAVRSLLGRRLGRPPASLTFDTDAMGKPTLTGAAAAVMFNLSHGGDCGALAISSRHAVGVDIEPLRAIDDAAALTRTVYTAAEQAAWRQLGPAGADAAFLRLWTRKEAVLKAIGLGLSLDPAGVDVGLTPDRTVIEVRGAARSWRVDVATLAHPDGAALAVAWV